MEDCWSGRLIQLADKLRVNVMATVATKTYVELKDEGYWLAGTRVSLDSVIYSFRQCALPDSIAQSYPLLNLEQVYGAITFYLANRSDIDAYLIAEEQAFDEMSQPLQADAPDLYQRLVAAKTSVKQS